MSVVNKIIVTCRLECGDPIDVSVKVENRPYTQEDKEKFCSKIAKLLVPVVDDTLYYQVRTWSGNAGKERRNWKRIQTMKELESVIQEVMVVKDEATPD